MAKDNVLLKDALGNEFTLRAKDISGGGDGSILRSMFMASLYPFDYGDGGCFQLTSKSGIMAAGLAAASPIYAFRWTSGTLLAVIKRIRISAWSLGTGFAAGIGTFDLVAARPFTGSDTNGVTDTISGNNGKLRTSMASSALAEIRHSSTASLIAGVRSLDAQPIASLNVGIGSAAFTPLSPSPMTLFEKPQGEHPLVLALNEGFVIQATLPATGTWSFAITPEWDEVPIY